MVNAGIYQYSAEPAFQRGRHLVVPVVLKLPHVPEQFNEALIYYFLYVFYTAYIPVTYAHCIILQQIVHLLLAVTVVCTATLDQQVYILGVISQMERTLKSQL